MRQVRNTDSARKASRLGLFGLVFFCLVAPACDNTCFFFVSNPSGGTIAVGTSTCKLSNANGTVSVRLTTSLQPTAAPSPGLQHIFVSLRGIEAHPSTTADEESREWQELAPTLKNQPMQVDLLEGNDDLKSANLVQETTIPAGTYSQVRMLLVPDQTSVGESLPERNNCGSAIFNCIVASDGAIRPLVLNGDRPQIRITSENISGGFFHVLPNSNTKLTLEFYPRSSLALLAGQAMQLTPVFNVRSGFSVESSGPDLSGVPIQTWPENQPR